MIEVLGYFSQFLFVAASASQALRSFRDGHSDGISHGLLWSLAIGFTIMIYYTIFVINTNMVLLLGYIGQVIMWSVVGYFKYLPKKKTIDIPDISLEDIEKAAL